jgi:hypothetical protein
MAHLVRARRRQTHDFSSLFRTPEQTCPLTLDDWALADTDHRSDAATMTRHLGSRQPFKDEPTSGTRVSVDLIVHASLIDLFNAYGVAVAPLPRSSVSGSVVLDVSVAAAFRNAGGPSGRITLSLPSPLLEHMKSAESTSIRMDWARELSSQLLGRIKNRLLPFGVRLELGLMTVLDPKVLQSQIDGPSGPRVYVGRTLRGPVLVTVQGLPPDSSLAYVGAGAATEGTLLWL